MGETIAKNKKAYHDISRQEIVPNGTVLVDKITSIASRYARKDTCHG